MAAKDTCPQCDGSGTVDTKRCSMCGGSGVMQKPKKQWRPGDIIQQELSFISSSVEMLPDGFIAGIASTPTLDHHGHKVYAGAFDESIKTKGLNGPKGVKLLAYHDWHKPAGIIKRLETVQDRLRLEAELNLNVTYVKDLHEIAKQNKGLNFSVGFGLVENGFEFVDDEKDSEDGEWLRISKGDLMEVSVVCFPACPDATMDFVKTLDDVAMFERVLRDNGIAKSRNEAHAILQLCKTNTHLFGQPLSVKPRLSAHPMPDAHQLKAAIDLTARVKALLGSR